MTSFPVKCKHITLSFPYKVMVNYQRSKVGFDPEPLSTHLLPCLGRHLSATHELVCDCLQTYSATATESKIVDELFSQEPVLHLDSFFPCGKIKA